MLPTGRCRVTYGAQGYAGQVFLLEPIGELQQRQVIAATEGFVVRAEQLFERSFARVPILFDLSGRSAGMFKVVGRRRWMPKPWIFAKYFVENLRDTVPTKWLISWCMKCTGRAR